MRNCTVHWPFVPHALTPATRLGTSTSANCTIGGSMRVKTWRNRLNVIAILLLPLLVFTLLSCNNEPEVRGPKFGTKSPFQDVTVYHFAVHPLHNPAKLTQAYQPLIDYLNSHLTGVRLSLEASRDYANFEEKYRARAPEFILPNPWQTLQAMKVGYRVIATAGEPQDFRGIFIARKDGGVLRPFDLKGKAVSYPSPTALAACIMPQYFLHDSGLNVKTDIENKYVGSQESSIMNVVLGLTAVGATWPHPWRAFQKDHPKEAAELKIIWETPSLINNSVMVRNDIPARLVDDVRTLLLKLHGTAQGDSILADMETARFLPASDQDYDLVRRYVANFEKEVRMVETK